MNITTTESSVNLTSINITCKTGYGYPQSCPQAFDRSDYTKCCRDYDKPACCLQRAQTICASRGRDRREGRNFDPPVTWNAVFCPRPNDPDDYTVCYFGEHGELGCYNAKWSMIVGGVIGSIIMLGLVTAVVMAILFCTGICGKCMTKGKANKHWQSRQQRIEQGRTAYTYPVQQTAPSGYNTWQQGQYGTTAPPPPPYPGVQPYSTQIAPQPYATQGIQQPYAPQPYATQVAQQPYTTQVAPQPYPAQQPPYPSAPDPYSGQGGQSRYKSFLERIKKF